MAAVVIKNEATAGRDFMNAYLATLSAKQQKEIAGKELALKERYYDILGSEADRKSALAVLEKQAAEVKLQSDKLALKEQKRMNKVYKANPLLMGQQMQAELTSKSNKQEMDLMRLMIQQSTQQIQGLNQQLAQNKFQYQQELNQKQQVFDLFLNPETTEAMSKALGEDEYAKRRGLALGKIAGVDVRETPYDLGFVAGKVKGALGTDSKVMSYEEAALEYQRGKVSAKDLWSIWSDRLEKQGYIFDGGIVFRPGEVAPGAKHQPNGIDISKQGALDKVLREDK